MVVIITRHEDLAQLGLSNGNDSESKIRKSYLLLARSKHPDKGGSKEAFQRLSNAYQRLTSNFIYSRSPSPAQPRQSASSQRGKPTGGSHKKKQDAPKTPKSRSQPAPETTSKPRHGEQWNREFYENMNREYYNFFRRSYGACYDRDEEKFSDYFTHWETATRQQRARERREHVKRGYDFRDKRTTVTASDKCMFCGVMRPIQNKDADNHGLDWKEYKQSQKVEGYPACNTCWSCKNKHDSVLTRKMAVRKFSVLEQNQSAFFFLLVKNRRCFQHQPETPYAEVTRSSNYFWYPDIEKEALARGWKPRGTKRTEVPWVRKDMPATPKTLFGSGEREAKRRKNAPKKPNSAVRKKRAPVVTPDKHSATVSCRKKLFSRDEKKRSVCGEEDGTNLFLSRDWHAVAFKGQQKVLSSDGDIDETEEACTSGDWRVAGARDY